MPILSPMAPSIPSRKNQKYKARTLAISDGTQQHATRETMLMQLNNKELRLIQTDANPCIVGSVMLLKGKPVMAHSQNLTRQPHCAMTRNELRSIITKLRAQPNILSECEVQVYINCRSLRYGHIETKNDAPWQLILQGSSLTLAYLERSDPVTADKLS
jgi:hypothetical protein